MVSDIMTDSFHRFITICQTLWFTISCLASPFQGLFITTFELTALSFILMFFAVSFAWWHKPMDVTRPITITASVTIEQMLSEGPPSARGPWYRTPLDFVSRKEWFLSLLWSYFTDLGFRSRIPLIHLFTRRISSRPHDRIRTDQFPSTGALAEVISVPFLLGYAVIFALAWNFQFPSRTERMLWRSSSVYMVFVSTFGALYSAYCRYVLIPNHTHSYGKPRSIRGKESVISTRPLSRLSKMLKTIRSVLSELRNVSPSKDPHLELPLAVIIPFVIMSANFCFFRAFVLIEDYIGLRSMPASAYETVQWNQYFPHIWSISGPRSFRFSPCSGTSWRRWYQGDAEVQQQCHDRDIEGNYMETRHHERVAWSRANLLCRVRNENSFTITFCDWNHIDS